MKNLKFIFGFAAGGFVLSLVCALTVRSSFLHKFVVALIFAVVFAGLAFLLQLVYTKFLTDDSQESEFGGDAPSAKGAAEQTAAVGQQVDLTIQDEELTQGNGSRFMLNGTPRILNASDVSSAAPERQPVSAMRPVTPASATAAPAAAVGAVQGTQELLASELEAAAQNPAQAQAESPAQAMPEPAASQPDAAPARSASAPQAPAVSGGTELDELPDMQDLTYSANPHADEEDDDDGSDNDSGYGGSASYSGRHNSDEIPADVKDAPLIAKAISTILSEESS